MAVEDVEKTAFLTPCGVYCYTCMPFGLRNAGATFQWLMHITLGPQLGKNVEAYIDDIVVKSREAKTLIQDLEETFASLNTVNLRLNPEKCACGVYCYTCMPFGLRNAGATFQWLMHITLGPQLGKNVEAYIDDIVVKSREAKTLIQDLEETFASLNTVNLRLNPEKCVFGVPSGKLLGFLVSH